MKGYLKLKKLIFKTIFFSLTTFCIINITGCIFAPEHKVSTFDLGIPKPLTPQNTRIYIMPFMNNTETAYQMVYRIGEYQIEKDPYNRWIKTPGIMITAFLRDAFRCHGTQNYDYTVFGEVILFEINLQEKCVVLSTNYRIKNKSNFLLKREVSFKEYFTEASPENFAKAMSKAAGMLAESIRDDLIKLKVNKAIQM